MTSMKLATAGDDIKLWDCRGYGLIKQFNPHEHNVSSICWSHDNTCLVSASTGGDKIVLNYNKGSSVTSKDLNLEKDQTVVILNNVSRFLVTGSTLGTVNLWDLKTQKLKKSFKDHSSAITTAQFNYNDTTIATGSESGQIVLHNVVTGIGSSPLVVPKMQAIRELKYSFYKKSLLGSVSDNGAVYLWDTNTRRLLHTFDGMHRAPATGLAFSPINEMLMLSVGLDKRIVCYDVQGKTAMKTMTTENPLTSIAFADGTVLAAGSTRGNVYMYDLRQGKTPIRTLTGHKSSVQCLAFHNKINSSTVNKKRSTEPSKTGTEKIDTDVGSTVSKKERQPSGKVQYEVFSPIREGHPPITIDYTDAVSENRPGVMGVSSHVPSSKQDSYNNSDGIFSPLNENDQNHSTDRQGPVGQGSSFTASPLVTSERTHSKLTELQTNNQISRSPRIPHVQITHPEFSSPRKERDANPKQLSSPRIKQPVSPQPEEYNRMNNGGQSSHSYHTQGQGHLQDHLPDGTTSRVTFAVDDITSAVSSTENRLALSSSDMSRSSRLSVTNERLQRTDAMAGDTGHNNVQNFQTEFVRNIVEDALEEFRDQVHRDIQCLQIEMLRQFHIQQEEIQSIMQQYSVNAELVEEIERLREENALLKKKF